MDLLDSVQAPVQDHQEDQEAALLDQCSTLTVTPVSAVVLVNQSAATTSAQQQQQQQRQQQRQLLAQDV